jgi:hypothetical protein
MTTLNDIGVKYKTDKSSIIHDYLKKYEKYFPFKRTDKIKILEIGVLNGDSIRTWKEYFLNAEIIAIDINPDCKKHEEERINIEIGDQTDESFLKNVTDKYGLFDLIIDDGSHINSHIIKSFKFLFNFVNPQGLYVVEDTSSSYWWDYGGGLKKEGTSIEFFKNVIDEVNFAGELTENFITVHARRDDLLFNQFKRKGYENLGMYIESINFLNSLILITKK